MSLIQSEIKKDIFHGCRRGMRGCIFSITTMQNLIIFYPKLGPVSVQNTKPSCSHSVPGVALEQQ